MSSASSGEGKKELSPKPSSVDKRSYVVAGAILSCSYGSQPSRLNMQMSHGVYVKGKPIMNVMDYVPNINIMPFGACGSMVNPAVIAATAAMGGVPQRVPCMPIVTMPWLGGKTDKTIDSFPSLLNDSTNMCMFCGKIKIEDDGQNLEYVPLLEKCMNTGEMQGPPEDTREWYEKAWDGIAQTGEDIWSGVKKTGNSFAEIGTDFWNGLGVRANKAFDSPYDFGNWLTVGAFDAAGGIVEGYKTRANNRNESVYDYVNWLSSGMADTIKGAFNPDDPLSKEHLMNSFGVFVSVAGARGVVPKGGGPTLPKAKVPEKTPVPKLEERTSPNINKPKDGTQGAGNLTKNVDPWKTDFGLPSDGFGQLLADLPKWDPMRTKFARMLKEVRASGGTIRKADMDGTYAVFGGNSIEEGVWFRWNPEKLRIVDMLEEVNHWQQYKNGLQKAGYSPEALELMAKRAIINAYDLDIGLKKELLNDIKRVQNGEYVQ